jgi:DNA replication protein DnaC
MASNPFLEIKERLSHAQVVPDTSTPSKPVCPTCKGHGSVVLDVDPDDLRFGKSFICPECGAERLKSIYWKNCGIPENRRGCTFETFRALPGTEKALAMALAVAAKNQTVVIYGPPGTGKTHLTYASVIESINSGKPARVIRCLEWLNEIKSRMRTPSAEEAAVTVEQLIRGHQLIPFLAIDELEVRTEWEIQTIDDLVCGREANQLPTLITTNWDKAKIEQVLPRIYSRAELVLNKGADYRKK